MEKQLAELETKAEPEKDPWTVMLRSADPRRPWNKNIKDRLNYAIEVKNAPKDLKYVRRDEHQIG